MADHNPNSTTTTATTSPAVHVHHAEMPEEHPERHEHSDVSVRGIWITVGAVFIVTILVHVLLYVVFFVFMVVVAVRGMLPVKPWTKPGSTMKLYG